MAKIVPKIVKRAGTLDRHLRVGNELLCPISNISQKVSMKPMYLYFTLNFKPQDTLDFPGAVEIILLLIREQSGHSDFGAFIFLTTRI